MTDDQFFATFPQRQAHIRRPQTEIVRSQQRSVRVLTECEMQFRHLGSHDGSRRRIILWRVPHDNPWYDPARPPILKIPFLAFADETVEDTDTVLLPIIHQIMSEARAKA